MLNVEILKLSKGKNNYELAITNYRREQNDPQVKYE